MCKKVYCDRERTDNVKYTEPRTFDGKLFFRMYSSRYHYACILSICLIRNRMEDQIAIG